MLIGAGGRENDAAVTAEIGVRLLESRGENHRMRNN